MDKISLFVAVITFVVAEMRFNVAVITLSVTKITFVVDEIIFKVVVITSSVSRSLLQWLR